MGLVLKVAPHEELMDQAVALASTYAENGKATVLDAKQLLYANYVEADMGLVQRREGEALQRRRGSPEQREAVAAFREKRQPNFRGL